jgi:high-affinity iron transporter
MGTLVGTILGLSAAALVGWLIFASAVRLNLRMFFNVTSVLLLFFAAGLFGLAVHEFQEAGLLPMTIEQVWNLNAVIDENAPLGLVLKALFGYNGNPSLLEVLGYVAYWVLALVGVRWWVNRRTGQISARPTA